MPGFHKNILIPIASAFMFGMYPAAAQLAYKHGANPLFLILISTFCRAASLVIFSGLRGHRLLPERGSPVKATVLAGFLQAVSIFGIITSLLYLPGPVMIVIVFTSTTMLLLLLVIRGETSLDGITVLSTIGAFIGVALVVDVLNSSSDLPIIGLSLAFLAALATTFRIYIFGKEVARLNPGVAGARIFSVTLLFTLLLLFNDTPTLPTTLFGWSGIILASISLCLGTFGMFYGISAVGTFEFSLFVKLEPVFTSLFAWLILGQILSITQYAGIVLVIGSLMLYNVYKFQQRKK